MIVKFINPATEFVQVSKINNATMTNDVDDQGNEKDSYVVILELLDELESTLFIHCATFFDATSILDNLYNYGKIDMSTSSDIFLSIYSDKLCCDSESDIEELLSNFDLSDLYDDQDDAQ